MVLRSDVRTKFSAEVRPFRIAWRGDVAGLYILEEQAKIRFVNHKAAAKAVCGWEGAAFDDCILSALSVCGTLTWN